MQYTNQFWQLTVLALLTIGLIGENMSVTPPQAGSILEPATIGWPLPYREILSLPFPTAPIKRFHLQELVINFVICCFLLYGSARVLFHKRCSDYSTVDKLIQRAVIFFATVALGTLFYWQLIYFEQNISEVCWICFRHTCVGGACGLFFVSLVLYVNDRLTKTNDCQITNG